MLVPVGQAEVDLEIDGETQEENVVIDSRQESLDLGEFIDNQGSVSLLSAGDSAAAGYYSGGVIPEVSPSVYVNGSWEGSQSVDNSDDIEVEIDTEIQEQTVEERSNYSGSGSRSGGEEHRIFHIPSIDPFDIRYEYTDYFGRGPYKVGYGHEISPEAANADHIYASASGSSSGSISGASLTVYNTNEETIIGTGIESSVTIDQDITEADGGGIGAVVVRKGSGSKSWSWTLHDLEISSDVATVESASISSR